MKKILHILFAFTLVMILSKDMIAQVAHIINISDFAYSPNNLTINEGDTVRFKLVSGNHPTISDNGAWSKITLNTPGEESAYILLTSNTTFRCEFHGSMTGSITVTPTEPEEPTSIKSFESKYQFKVSPNPVEDQLRISITPGDKNIVLIKIFDLIGKEIASVDLNHRTGTSVFNVDFSQLKPGIYFCNVYSDKGIVETKKILRTK